jgi:lysozyme
MVRIIKTGIKGKELIKQKEGFRSKPYLCPAKVPTIGYGATYYPNGKRVTLEDDPITEEWADVILDAMLVSYEKAVDSYTRDDINQNQFDALVSFAYNLGVGNLKSSTLLRKVNGNPSDPSIKDEFLKWNKADGKVLKGLTQRRLQEAELYFA